MCLWKTVVGVFLSGLLPEEAGMAVTRHSTKGLMNSTPLLASWDKTKKQNTEYLATLRTDWTDISKCGLRCAYFPVGDFEIWGHWRKALAIPVTIISLFLISGALFVLDTNGFVFWSHCFPSMVWLITADSVLFLLLLMSLLSYVLTIVKGPGYLPYNWNVDKRLDYDFDTMMDSMAVFQEQIDYGKTHERPPRSSFSITARRYVLRADHFCTWMQTFIGLNNHRFFLLSTFWISIYCFAYIGFRYFWIYDIIVTTISTKHFDYYSIPGIIFVLIGLFAGFYSFYYFVRSFINLYNNLTQIEKWNNRQPSMFGRSRINNFEEVCGSKKYLPFWPFPCCTFFKPKSNGLYLDDDDYESYCQRSMYTECEEPRNAQLTSMY